MSAVELFDPILFTNIFATKKLAFFLQKMAGNKRLKYTFLINLTD